MGRGGSIYSTSNQRIEMWLLITNCPLWISDGGVGVGGGGFIRSWQEPGQECEAFEGRLIFVVCLIEARAVEIFS